MCVAIWVLIQNYCRYDLCVWCFFGKCIIDTCLTPINLIWNENEPWATARNVWRLLKHLHATVVIWLLWNVDFPFVDDIFIESAVCLIIYWILIEILCQSLWYARYIRPKRVHIRTYREKARERERGTDLIEVVCKSFGFRLPTHISHVCKGERMWTHN